MAGALVSPETADQIRRVIRIVLQEELGKLGNLFSGIIGDDRQRKLWIGKTTAAHTKGTTQSVNMYGNVGDTQGSETTVKKGDESVTAYDVYNRFADVENDKWVLVIPTTSGFEMIAAEC